MILVERPGVEINIQTAPSTYSQKDGVVAMVLPLDKGTAGEEYITLTQHDDLSQDFTLGGLTNTRYKALLERMLQYCKAVKVYPVASSKQASLVVNPQVTLYASNNGVYGNALRVEVKPDAQQSTYFVATIFYNNVMLESYSGLKRWMDVGNLTNLLSVFVTGADELTEGTYQLAGGTSPNLTIGDYSYTLGVLQQVDFNVFVTPLSIQPADGDVWATVENATDKAIKDIREQDDQLKRYIVTSETNSRVAATNLPFKYVLSSTGLYFNDGSVYRDYEAKCILAAILAGTDANVSLTNLAVTGATGVYNVRSNRDIKYDLQTGYIMFYQDSQGTVRIVKDQTSFVRENGKTPTCYTSGLCIREVDYIVDRIKQDFEAYWMGIEKGTEDSAKLYRDVVYATLENFQTQGYITNVSVEDVRVALNGRSGFVLDLAIQPTDAIEKLYINVEVR